MMRVAADEGRPLVPLAGGTDLFVTLNVGAQAGRRYLDLWRLDELRGVESRGKRGLSFGGARDLHRLHRVEGGAQAAADPRRGCAPGRRRADPESRHARRQHRERLARRPTAAGADGRRRDASSCARSTASARAARRVLHRLSQDGAPARRADRAHRRRRARRARSGSARSERARRRRSRRWSWPPSAIASRSAASRRLLCARTNWKRTSPAAGATSTKRSVSSREDVKPHRRRALDRRVSPPCRR